MVRKTNNHLSLQSAEHKKKPWHMALEIEVMAWDMYRNVAELSLLMGSPPSLYEINIYDWRK